MNFCKPMTRTRQLMAIVLMYLMNLVHRGLSCGPPGDRFVVLYPESGGVEAQRRFQSSVEV